jgi:hypothetical protein
MERTQPLYSGWVEFSWRLVFRTSFIPIDVTTQHDATQYAVYKPLNIRKMECVSMFLLCSHWLKEGHSEFKLIFPYRRKFKRVSALGPVVLYDCSHTFRGQRYEDWWPVKIIHWGSWRYSDINNKIYQLLLSHAWRTENFIMPIIIIVISIFICMLNSTIGGQLQSQQGYKQQQHQ